MWGKIVSENISPLDIHPKNIVQSKINKGEHPHQFHFNTIKLNEYLVNVCKARDIEFEDDVIEHVNIKDGKIINLKGKNTHSADFYIDCSGFKKLLINKLGAKWVSFKEYLPMNEAIAFPTEDTKEYNAWTLAKAMNAGWMWRIPTWGRWGNGYVYDNNYINAEEAQKEAEKYLNKKVKIFKNIKFDAGKVDRAWIENCCAIGLSASFAEPLEASNIGTTINQAFLLIHYLSNYTKEDIEQYNLKCNDIFDNVRDFVLIHYLVKKSSSKFWKELKIKIPESLKNKLEMWKNRLPLGEDFDKNYLLFNQQNFILVLHGIGFFNKSKIKQEYDLSNDMLKELSNNIFNEKIKKDEFEGLPHKEYLNYSYYHNGI
jgi:tryptophan halogenase